MAMAIPELVDVAVADAPEIESTGMSLFDRITGHINNVSNKLNQASVTVNQLTDSVGNFKNSVQNLTNTNPDNQPTQEEITETEPQSPLTQYNNLKKLIGIY